MLSNQNNWSIWYIELYICICVCMLRFSFLCERARFRATKYLRDNKKEFRVNFRTINFEQNSTTLFHRSFGYTMLIFDCFFLFAVRRFSYFFFSTFFTVLFRFDRIFFLNFIFFLLQNKQLYDVFRISIILLHRHLFYLRIDDSLCLFQATIETVMTVRKWFQHKFFFLILL